MEPANLIAEEWGSLSGQFTAEETDFMAQLLGVNFSVTEKHCVNASFGTNSNSYFPSNVSNTNFLCFSQGSNSSNDSTTGNIFSTTTNSGTYFCDQATNIDSLSMVFCLGDDKISPHSFPWDENLSQNMNESIHEGSVKLDLADNNLQAKGEQEMMVSEPSEEDRSKNLENPAKRFRNSTEVSKNMRNAGKSPKHPEAPNLYRKSRATSGPATDAQSMYARRRRERINERLRILQNLVPNGTKVDISTMLEEAVQYVKFLQLQIKLLSSDDLWMYAPIAYNGINIGIGLDLSISATTNGR